MTQTRPQTEEEQTHFLRYLQPGRWPILARFPVPDSLLDELMVGALERTANAHANELMQEVDYRVGVDNLPFGEGDVVVALGDSITADRLGWFDLIAASLRLAGRAAVRTHNLGISGDTSADVLERWDLVAATRATHVLVMLGTNDVRGHGLHVRYRMLSSAETVRNLRALEALVTSELGARLTVITPPPSDQARADAFMADLPVGWRASDIDQLAQAIGGLGADRVDVHAALLDDVRAGRLVEPDGVHLNVEGQKAAARLVVAQLGRT
jgi:acyl-CoA thioesterase I